MDRRVFLFSAAGGLVSTVPAIAALNDTGQPMLRGTLSPAELGLAEADRSAQSQTIQNLLDAASAEDRQVFLQPGTYFVSELKLPPRTRLAGVPGATRLVFAGGSHMIFGDHCEIVELSGITFDGAALAMDEHVPGIVHVAECDNVLVENCTLMGGGASGLALDRSSGRIRGNTIRKVRDAGIRAIESRGLTISDNIIEDNGNAGILIHRWLEGDDGTIVTGNRIARIGARDGGTGQNGNGINIFRAHGVIVSNNRISDCAFTAVRANSANNVQITGNNCSGCGEIGIFSEYAFEGAMIANNIIDGAATGIGVVNFNDGGRIAVVSSNIIRNLTGAGPYSPNPPGFGTGIAIEADAAVSGNVIDGAPLFGIQVGWGPSLRDVAATGNVIRRAPIGIAVSVVDGAGAAVISDNLISGALSGAIVGMRWAEIVTDDLAVTGVSEYPHLLVERNRVG